MRNRRKTLLRDHSVLEVTTQACPKHIQSQLYLRLSLLEDLKDLPHGRVKLVEIQGGKFPCPRCSREFLSKSMLVNHSRDHKENVYGCNKCPWHFNTVAGLIKHCQDTHDDRHFACTTCREVFANNPNLCKHTQIHHVKICHLCHRIFVSDDKLFDHMKETHPGAAGHT